MEHYIFFNIMEVQKNMNLIVYLKWSWNNSKSY